MAGFKDVVAAWRRARERGNATATARREARVAALSDPAKVAAAREHAQAWALRETARATRKPRSAADVAAAAKAAGMSVADYAAAQTLLAARETAHATSRLNDRAALEGISGGKLVRTRKR